MSSLDDIDVKSLTAGFELVSFDLEAVTAAFYDKLFADYPGVKPLFSHLDVTVQKKKLAAALHFVMNNLTKPGELVGALKEMGARHQGYGAEEGHYAPVAETLLAVFKEKGGADWTDSMTQAWNDALTLIAEVMLSAYDNDQAKERPTNQAKESTIKNQQESVKSREGENTMSEIDDLKKEMRNLKSVVEGSATAMMTCDIDFNVTYANPATVQMVSKYIDEFKRAFPGFALERLIGTSIDTFHKNPAHQRSILSDLRNYPYNTDINVGDLTFELNISALIDETGQHNGCSLEWADVTETRASARKAASLNSTVEGSATAIMTCDTHLNVTYANPATIAMVSKHLNTFEKAYPGFKLANLIGTNIDGFHKNPAYQRGILSDPKNLPHTADITVGDLTFVLNISALLDAEGNYMGCSLEWADVTRLRIEAEKSASLSSTVEGSATAIMTCDIDLRVTYANPSTITMVSKHLSAFEKAYPGFKLANLIGTNIDGFHKNPAYQRQILADPSNLPHTADITVGDLTFSLNISALRNSEGEYTGNSLEWADVTEARKSASEAASLQSMVQNVETNLMICDLDRVVTYANPAVIEMMGGFERQIQTALPNFSVKTVIGTCIDDFHVNPAHQASLLADPNNFPYKTELKVAGLEFGINGMALRDSEGEFVGIAVEWLDNNDRAKYRDEVNMLINCAKTGDLSKRGEVGSMSEIFRPMLQGINEIIDAIVEPVSEIRACLNKVAEGDLTAYVNGEYEGDHEQLKLSLNDTLDNLNDILNQVKSSSSEMASGSSQVSDSSQSISQGATEQAASLEQITASMNQMKTQTKQNADNATQANQLAQSAQNGAEKGNEMMNNMLGAMSEIDDSAQKISKIIKVIDEIAFQTNLLALNAAVEAARAGVHGKGFAVVAEEVRNLAARSANAAKETTELIEGSIKKVNAGTSVANTTSESLKEIVGGIGKVTDLIGEIAAASNEQALGINQVNQGLVQLDQVTQQNTANAEESAAASMELSQQANQLLEILKQFSLKSTAANVPGLEGLTPEVLAAIQAMISKGQLGGIAETAKAALPAPKIARNKAANDIIPLEDFGIDDKGRY
jgi:methyl-accepting chemotaxis protein